MDSYVTLDDVALLCGVAPATVLRWTRANAFPQPTRLGRSYRWALSTVERHLSGADRHVVLRDGHKATLLPDSDERRAHVRVTFDTWVDYDFIEEGVTW